MEDPTEDIRRGMVAEINSQPNTRELLEAQYGQRSLDSWTNR